MDKPLIKAFHSYTQKPDLEKFHMHTHEDYEIYCFLSGNAQYYVEGSIYTLKPGDILIMKKAEAHSLLINSLIPYERIIVNFEAEALLGEDWRGLRDFMDRRPLGKYNRYPASMFQDGHWRYYLERICKAEDIEKKRLYLTALVHELFEGFERICNEEQQKDSAIEIISFINRHLTEELDLDMICQRFYLSKSQLNRRFKRVTGSTVWEYISTKRLLLAKELLQKGERPTYVAEKCGFNDYCTFFRAYKTRFQSSPKKDFRQSD